MNDLGFFDDPILGIEPTGLNVGLNINVGINVNIYVNVDIGINAAVGVNVFESK